MWHQDVEPANIFIENSDLGKEFLEASGAAIYVNSPSLFEEKFMEAKQCHLDQEKSELGHAGALASEEAPGAEKRANKRSSRLAASALWIINPPRLARAGVVIVDDMLNDGKCSADASEIKAGMIRHGSDEFTYCLST